VLPVICKKVLNEVQRRRLLEAASSVAPAVALADALQPFAVLRPPRRDPMEPYIRRANRPVSMGRASRERAGAARTAHVAWTRWGGSV